MKKEREIVLEILSERSENKYLKDIYMEKMAQYSYLTTVQKAFIKRLSQGTLEWQITIDTIIRSVSSIRLKKINPKVLNILRFSTYQILFMDRVPEYSIVNEAVELVKMQKEFRATAFCNAILREMIRKKESLKKKISDFEKQKNWSLAYSCPQELVDLLLTSYEEDMVSAILKATLQEKPLNLWWNDTTKDSMEAKRKFHQSQSAEGVFFDDVYKFTGNIEEVEDFQKGFLHVQDEASMLVGHLASRQKPKILFDMCAAPGGKSVHIAGLLEEAEIHSFDVSSEKIAKIEQNIKRLHRKNITTEIGDATVFDASKFEMADCVIADVPCAGLGVISDKPDIKYRISNENIKELYELQKKILDNVSRYVKKGGYLFYSTCSILPEENHKRIRQFLEENMDFILCDLSQEAIFQSEKVKALEKSKKVLWQDGMLQLLPDTFHGFFIAKLRKK